MNRVVITGLGVISSLGEGIENNWNNLINGKSGIDYIMNKNEFFDIPVYVASEVKDFDLTRYGIDKKDIKKISRNIQFAIACTKMALDDANLKITKDNEYDTATIISSGIGGIETIEEAYNTINKKGYKRVSPYTIPSFLTNMAGANVAINFGIKGPNKCIITACATGTDSVGEAYEMIKSGKVKYAICGGTESAINDLTLSAFLNMKAITTNENPHNASKPFSKDRKGFVIGEGAGVLILETLDSAIKRKARIYAEIVGYSQNCDAFHITNPADNLEASTRAILKALEEAKIDIEDVDYINAHGTSTKLNDLIETKVIKNAFKNHAYKLLISSNKSQIGHTLGAAGAIEAIFLAKTIETDIVPPTINLDLDDEECDLNYVKNKSIIRIINIAISNSLGFGGHNSVLVMKKYRG